MLIIIGCLQVCRCFGSVADLPVRHICSIVICRMLFFIGLAMDSFLVHKAAFVDKINFLCRNRNLIAFTFMKKSHRACLNRITSNAVIVFPLARLSACVIIPILHSSLILLGSYWPFVLDLIFITSIELFLSRFARDHTLNSESLIRFIYLRDTKI